MWGIAGIVAVTAAVAMIEAPSLWKKKWRKELLVFSVLLAAGASLSIALSLHVDIPNLLDLITFLYKPLSEALTSFLK